jgi:hypothetical protein
MRRPSGDQRGEPVAGLSKEVNWSGLLPSLSEIQISWLPERSEANAILLPSGENCGLTSRRVESISFLGAASPAGALGPSVRQMLASRFQRAYASRSRGRAIEGK